MPGTGVGTVGTGNTQAPGGASVSATGSGGRGRPKDEEDDADGAEDSLRILNAITRNPGQFHSEGDRARPVSAWLKSAEYVL